MTSLSDILPSVTVDSHAHVFDAATPLTTEAWEHRERPAPASALLAEMAAHGVGHAVLATAGAYGGNNVEFEQALSQHHSFRATASVPLDVSAARLTALSGAGFVGTRLHRHKIVDAPDLADADHRRFFHRIADAGWHVHLTEHPDRMEQTLRILEDVGPRIVVDHLGLVDRPEGVAPSGFKAILEAVGRGRCWVKLSGHFRFKHAQAAVAQSRTLVAAAPDRLLWASDWPFVGYRDTMCYADAWEKLARYVPDPALRALVAGENAFALYFA